MIEGIEKALLTGVGILSLTEQKTSELFEELRQKFNLSEEEGKAIFEKLSQSAQENQQKLEEIAREEIRATCQRMGVASQADYDSLSNRVQLLEQRIRVLEEKVIEGG